MLRLDQHRRHFHDFSYWRYGALLLASCAWLVVGCKGDDAATGSNAPPTVAIQALQLSAPAQIAAGQPLTVVVQSEPVTATGMILLTAQGSFGYLPQQSELINGRAHFVLTPLHTQRAGQVHLLARRGALAAAHDLTIVPGPPVDPLLPLVSPRSLVADGNHATMAVMAPRDEFNNPVADGTVVVVRVQHPILPGAEPATGLAIVRTRTQHLLAWASLSSRTRAGRMLIAASAGNSHSPERFVVAVPGPPRPFTISAEPLTAPADGRQIVQIGSAPIRDRYGNQLLAGTNVTLLAAMPNGELRTMPATIIDGQLAGALQAPAQPGPLFVRAWIEGISSNVLQIDFTPGPAVQRIPVVTQRTAAGVVVRAGPLVGQLDQFIPDGTEVTFRVTAPDATVITTVAPADYGYAELLLRTLTLQPGRYQVAVAAGTGSGAATFTIPPPTHP